MATPGAHAASARRRVLAETAAWWTIRGLQTLATWLPERWLETAAACIGDVACLGARVARAWPLLSQAEQQQQQVVRASYAHLALALLWTLRLLGGNADGADALRRLVEVDAETRALLTQLLPEKDKENGLARSAIVTSGHVGMWELLPALLGSSSLLPDHTQWIVYRPLHNARVDALVQKLRKGDSRELVADKNCFQTLQDALTSVSGRPALVGLVADQRSSNPRARCSVRFLGQETLLSTGAARLHVATRAPLWFAAVVANPTLRYGADHKPFKLVLRPITINKLDQEDDGSCVQRLTQAYAVALEETVRSYPSQYLWVHDLWSDRAQQLLAE